MTSEASQRIRAAFVKDNSAQPIPLEMERQQWEESALQAPLPAGTTIEPITIEGIPCERVSCQAIMDTADNNVLILLHGGGYNAGSCKTHREIAAHLSAVCGISVLTVDYRLAPEHPFPAAVEDVTKVYCWLIDHGTRPNQIVLAGDSAGGGLVVSTLLTLRDKGVVMPAAAILISAWLDLTLSGETMRSHADVDPLTSYEGLLKAARLYINDGDPANPVVSPVFADLSGLPPLLLHVGDHELLLSDSLRLAEKARAAGIDITFKVWPEMWHVFHAWASTLPEGQQALDEIGIYVRARLNISA